ncbi:hypothetical protein ACO2Q0_18060 [Phenylobacterium sp. VNQ135]|uniref:hypothetical protein n=1 Tax=Phenylobacterium sp. VNQ135 TaxID=3400922 RepID=UPI003C04DAB0
MDLVTTKCGVATAFIGRRAAENVLHAIRYAGEVGRPINAHVTINFATLGIGDDAAGAVFRDLQARLSRWWRYERAKGRDLGPLLGVHSHANPAGSRHVHWMTHLPASIRGEFEAKTARMLRKITGVDDLKDALHVGDVETPGSLAKYILKGIDPAYAGYLHIKPANEGIVSGRRTGASRAISRAARKAAGWKRKKSERR